MTSQLAAEQNANYREAPCSGRLSPVQRLACAVARLARWRFEIPALPDRCVITGAHHTSGMDFFVGMLALLASGMEIRWAAKDTLFFWPAGPILRSLGGLPVNRRARTNWVARMVETFAASRIFRLAILPEGTRRFTDHWKTGFYHIARLAGVPIVFAFADYERRVVGWGPSLMPTGDIEADFEVIREFYAGIHPRFPERAGEVSVRKVGQG